ncbi:MAG TPA: nuclear transport factor 2 family protein [Acidimicrobiia bacterium]|jgi:hypothetical protein|nr:nuclear transport factor 2 family protein [Acidimicrobiia bacterium]
MNQQDDPVETISRFLRLVEARRLEEASEFLARDVQITFPGGRQFGSLEEQVASGAGRFRRVRKVFERFDALETDDASVVYVYGTLEGLDASGVAFSGVRFIDRFELQGGAIVDQRVWNDMAEMGVVEPHAGQHE